jgi:glycosyltransferase involved in cell wall biosynthesis
VRELPPALPRTEPRSGVPQRWPGLPAGLASGRFSWWFEDTNAWLRNVDFDIGLAPLVPSVFNQAKSPIKTAEYAALGIPAIASDVGPYPGFVEDGVTGFLVRQPHEWAAALKALADDPEDASRELAGACKTIVHATHDLVVLGRIAHRCVAFDEDRQVAAEG